jgi:hypothetical protein
LTMNIPINANQMPFNPGPNRTWTMPSATSDESVLTLLQRMTDCADGRAAVLDDGGRVIGVVSPTDINRTVLMHDLRPFDPYQRAHGADLTTWVGSGSGRR